MKAKLFTVLMATVAAAPTSFADVWQHQHRGVTGRSGPIPADVYSDVVAKGTGNDIARRAKIEWSSYAKYTPHPPRDVPISTELSHDSSDNQLEGKQRERSPGDDAHNISGAKEAAGELDKREKISFTGYKSYSGQKKRAENEVQKREKISFTGYKSYSGQQKRANPSSADASSNESTQEGGNDNKKRAKIEWASYAKYTPHPPRSAANYFGESE